MSIMTMHTLIRMFTNDQYRHTAKLVHEVNERLCENSIVQSGGGFITLLYAAVDTDEHLVRWTSAGHPLALLHRLDTGQVTQVGTEADGGLPLGISPGLAYDSSTAQLPPASRLLLYSDGLPDAFPMGQTGYTAFGVRGITETLRSCKDESLEATLDRLFRDSSDFTGETGRHDDTSAVLLERIGV